MKKLWYREHVEGLAMNKRKGITSDIAVKEGQKGLFVRFWKGKRLREFLSCPNIFSLNKAVRAFWSMRGDDQEPEERGRRLHPSLGNERRLMGSNEHLCELEIKCF